MPLSSSIKGYSCYYYTVGAYLTLELVGIYGVLPAMMFNVKS